MREHDCIWAAADRARGRVDIYAGRFAHDSSTGADLPPKCADTEILEQFLKDALDPSDFDGMERSRLGVSVVGRNGRRFRTIVFMPPMTPALRLIIERLPDSV